MANKDLRNFLEEIEKIGELKRISGAETEEDIGGLVDIFMRDLDNPALLFDDVPGFPTGHRVLANIIMSRPRCALALGLPPEATEEELIKWWRHYLGEAPAHPPVEVNGGPLVENVAEGEAVNIQSLPSPKWHEHDGGNFIGTGCIVAMRDPDTGWVNYGTYRVQAHEPRVATVMMSPGKHARLLMKKYHDRGEKCPVAVVAGVHPVMFMIGGFEVPYETNELDVVGGIFGESVEVINMPATDLPVPASAEIAFDGFIDVDDEILEGPLGEWTGYYAGGQRPEPAIRIETLMHRDNPVITGAIPAVPPNDNTYYMGAYRAAAVWNQLEAAGIPGVKGVYAHEAGGSRMWLTVSIEQMYGGHSKQAGLIASQCHAGAYANRWVVVVDDDIDPSNMNDVVWAMCTRHDPREGIDVINGCWSTHLDPMCFDDDNDRRNSRVVVDACIPFRRRGEFPAVARSSQELDDRIRAKYSEHLPEKYR